MPSTCRRSRLDADRVSRRTPTLSGALRSRPSRVAEIPARERDTRDRRSRRRFSRRYFYGRDQSRPRGESRSELVPADARRCRDGGHGGAMREHNVADTCRQPLIFTARARRAGIRRAPPRQQKERAVLFEIHGAFSDRLSLSPSLSLSLSRARFFSGLLLARRTSTARRKIFQRR